MISNSLDKLLQLNQLNFCTTISQDPLLAHVAYNIYNIIYTIMFTVS